MKFKTLFTLGLPFGHIENNTFKVYEKPFAGMERTTHYFEREEGKEGHIKTLLEYKISQYKKICIYATYTDFKGWRFSKLFLKRV